MFFAFGYRQGQPRASVCFRSSFRVSSSSRLSSFRASFMLQAQQLQGQLHAKSKLDLRHSTSDKRSAAAAAAAVVARCRRRSRRRRRHNLRFTIYDPQFTITIYDQRFTIHNLRFTIYDQQSTIYDLRFTAIASGRRQRR